MRAAKVMALVLSLQCLSSADGFFSAPPSSCRPVSTCLQQASSAATIVDTSTLMLLEHINLNVPSQEHILPFYMNLLGCGLDPRKASNLNPDSPKKTIWANCGASQFHLPFGDEAQTIPGHIGLRYESLEGLKARLQDDKTLKQHFDSFDITLDPRTKAEVVHIKDLYGNVFQCRAKESLTTRPSQPIILKGDTDQWGDIADQYGKATATSECRGIDYVEFQCPPNTADKIALFYDSVFDASVNVFDLGDGTKICMVAVGDIDAQGKAEQSILFRERTAADGKKATPYDGHHIALYVGSSSEDFEQAFRNADFSGIIWCNPRFQDQADTIEGARKWKQFRFKNIIDMETGETLMELEHEIRSIEHESWLR